MRWRSSLLAARGSGCIADTRHVPRLDGACSPWRWPPSRQAAKWAARARMARLIATRRAPPTSTAKMSRSTKAIDPMTKQRYAELIGLGLTHPEASRVTGISVRSGERLMAEPEYRTIADDFRRSGGRQNAASQAISEMLEATLPDGSPDHARRGAGLYLSNPSLIDGFEHAEQLPPGTRLPLGLLPRTFGKSVRIAYR